MRLPAVEALRGTGGCPAVSGCLIRFDGATGALKRVVQASTIVNDITGAASGAAGAPRSAGGVRDEGIMRRISRLDRQACRVRSRTGYAPRIVASRRGVSRVHLPLSAYGQSARTALIWLKPFQAVLD
jgi:hypothetical protein